MEILFLGTGAATASPLPFCNCETCRAAREAGGKDFRRRSSVLIDGKILIDLGPDCVAAAHAFGADISRTECLLQTHAHSDHFDAGHLITRIPAYAARETKHLTLFASPACVSRMSEMLGREEEGANLNSDFWLRALNMSVTPMRHGCRARFGEYEIIAIESSHDVAGGSLLYIVRKGDAAFFYACDTPVLTEAAWELLGSLELKLTCAAIDHTYGPGTPGGGHLCADEVAEAVVRLKCGLVYATHISHEGMPLHAKLEKWAGERGYKVAYDGMRVLL